MAAQNSEGLPGSDKETPLLEGKRYKSTTYFNAQKLDLTSTATVNAYLCDSYSLGIALISILVKSSTDNMTDRANLDYLKAHTSPFINPEVLNVLTGMTAKNPSERLSVIEAKDTLKNIKNCWVFPKK